MVKKYNKKYLDVVIIFLVIFLTLLYRRYDAFTNPQLWAENGTIIFKEWETYHFNSILIIYSGYFLVVQRIIGAVIGLLSINYLYIPIAYNLSAFIVTFLVAIGLWNSALRLNVKHRILYATLFVLIPVGNELYMDEASLQWITAIYLINYMFAWNNKINEKHYLLNLLLLFICATSGPYSAVLLPLTLLMVFLNRKEATIKRLIPLFVIFLGGIIQAICIKFIQPAAFTGRSAGLNGFEKEHFHLLKLFTKNISEMLYFNSGVLPQMPDRLKTIFSLLILIGFVLFFIISYRKIENKRKYVLLLSAALCFGSFIIAYWPKESYILSLEIARYYFLPYICLGWLLILAWDEKIKIIYIALYMCFMLLHSHFIRTALPDKNWKGQIKEYYEGKRDTIKINPDGWEILLPPNKERK